MITLTALAQKIENVITPQPLISTSDTITLTQDATVVEMREENKTDSNVGTILRRDTPLKVQQATNEALYLIDAQGIVFLWFNPHRRGLTRKQQ